jgi:NMD protein affecting ribosome stability and mRNA decay
MKTAIIDTRYSSASTICSTCGRGPKNCVRFVHPVDDPDEMEINICSLCLRVAESVLRQGKAWVMDSEGNAYLEETLA